MNSYNTDRRPSTDITDGTGFPRPPSPAPTYHSTIRATQGQSRGQDTQYTEKSASSNRDSTSTWSSSFPTEKPHKPTPGDQNTFYPLEEPFDTSHPHYIPPSNLPPSLPSFHPPPPPSRRSHFRLPRKSILLPWTLFTIFFLLTLWYTSIALGVRFFTALSPVQTGSGPDVNVVINIPGMEGQDGNRGGVQISTVISIPISAPPATPTPTPTSESKSTTAPPKFTTTDPADKLAPIPGAEPDPDRGSNTVTGMISKKAVETGVPRSGFRTVVRGR